MFLSLVIALARPRLRWVYLALAVALGVVVVGFVDLTPEVGADFFFSTDDPKLQADAKIDRMFVSGPQIIVAAESANTRSAAYAQQVGRLSAALAKVKGISQVRSITSGPSKPEEAWKSPLWSRLLLAPEDKATNLIIELNTDDYDEVVPRVESVVRRHRARGFNLAISGVPFVSEQISRNLLRDLKTFGLAALVLFSVLIIVVFRSLQVLLGALSACAIAAFLTLLAGPITGREPGLLTPNVSTIIFVLTLSHIMFLAANWTNAARQEAEESGNESRVLRSAIQWTVPGSFWSMAANLLGFLTLLLVAAKPIRQFGVSCSIGAVIAFATAYLVFPSFLRAVSVHHFERWPGLERLSGVLGSGRHTWALIAGAVLGLVAIPGLWRLNTDPSLLEYFKPGTALRTGLERIDRTGGSVPLKIAVADAEGGLLNTDEAYKKLWELQQKLEQDPDVGAVISLPVLLAEARRPVFSFLFSLEGLLEQMEKPQYGRIADSFVTRDRRVCLFFLRMKESGRELGREQIVQRLDSMVRRQGFVPILIGGLYRLQGELSHLIARSLLEGLVFLFILFSLISFVISRNSRVSLAMIACFSLIPLLVLGIIGYLRMSVDLISAPAANVALGIGIDGMFHFVVQARRISKGLFGDWSLWQKARELVWRPVTASTLIISLGFGLFGFSQFPPTQRFGLAVVGGMFVSAIVVLLIFPRVAAFFSSHREASGSHG
ncbi:MAG: RND family transporter [Acidobacteriota bacterium]